MGEAGAKPTQENTTEERIRRAQATGWAAFLAKLYAGNSISALDTTRALLGLGQELERHRKDVNDRFDAVSDTLRSFQKQILAVFARQELLHSHFDKLWRAFAEAMSDTLKAIEAAEREDRAWRALPWWKRRKTPRPSPAIEVVFKPPALPTLPPLLTEEEQREAEEDVASTPKTPACAKCGDTGRIGNDIPCDCIHGQAMQRATTEEG